MALTHAVTGAVAVLLSVGCRHVSHIAIVSVYGWMGSWGYVLH